MLDMLEEAFGRIDVDRSGFIDKKELEALCKDMGETMSKDELQESMEYLDHDGSGKIEKNEFTSWWMQTRGPKGGDDGFQKSTAGQKLDKVGKKGVNKMLEIKRERMRAEEDVKLLANRLQHLRAEEEKAVKRIQETQNRTNEILTLKERNSKSKQFHTSLKTTRQVSIMGSTQENLTRAEERKRAKEQIEEKKNREREEQVLKLKAQRNMNEKAIKAAREQSLQKSVLQKERVKQHEEELRRKKVLQTQKLEDKQIKEALQRLRDEQRRLAIAEQSIRDMEGAEESFIDRLKQAQVDERKAYEFLKGVVQD